MGKLSRFLVKALYRLLGFFIFLLILFGLNVLAAFIKAPVFTATVSFLNQNLWLFIVMSVMFFIADLFRAISFPFNLPWPIFSAIGSTLVALFIMKVIGFIFAVQDIGQAPFWSGLGRFLYPLVFMIALISGYISLFMNLDRQEEEEMRPRRRHHRS